ncbi:MAG: hypothetical protein R3F19_08500 [Verrucomicrobiales bacterium]
MTKVRRFRLEGLGFLLFRGLQRNLITWWRWRALTIVARPHGEGNLAVFVKIQLIQINGDGLFDGSFTFLISQRDVDYRLFRFFTRNLLGDDDLQFFDSKIVFGSDSDIDWIITLSTPGPISQHLHFRRKILVDDHGTGGTAFARQPVLTFKVRRKGQPLFQRSFKVTPAVCSCGELTRKRSLDLQFCHSQRQVHLESNTQDSSHDGSGRPGQRGLVNRRQFGVYWRSQLECYRRDLWSVDHSDSMPSGLTISCTKSVFHGFTHRTSIVAEQTVGRL